MTRRINILALAVAMLLASVITVPALAVGDSEFLFYGYAKYTSGVPDMVGSVLEVYGIMLEVSEVPLPIPLDLDNYEFTVWVSGMTVATSDITATLISLTYQGGEIRIYADAMPGGTAADYGDPSTFTDGELVLVASVDDGWPAFLYDFDMDGKFTLGANGGTCDFYGGTMLGDLVDAEYYLDDWGFFGSPYVDPNPPLIVVPNGFHRIFNTKITAPNDPTAAESASWGQVKGLYR